MPTTVVAACPMHAHVTPLLAVARALVAAGHRVRFLTGERFRAEVEATGAELAPLPADAGFDERTLDADNPGRAGRTGVSLLRWDLEHLFIGRFAAQVAALDAVLDEAVGALVFEPLFLGGFAVTARPRDARPRTVVVSPFPSTAPHPGVPPFGPGLTPAPGSWGRVRDALARAAVDRLALGPVQAAARRAVRAAGAVPPPGPVFGWVSAADVTVQLTVPAFEYPRPLLGDTFRLVGPVHVPSGAAPGAPTPAWWGDLDDRPVVHVTQGTVANADPRQLVRPTIDALADEDVLVVVATGGRPVEHLGALPGNVRAAPMLPYAALLPRTDVMVTNGGYGGVHWALAHGVPLVVAGATEDKAEVAARVAWSGTGVRLRGNRPSAAQVRDAVATVRGDTAYRAAARRVAAQIAAAPGAAGVVAAVEGRPHVAVTGG